MNKEIVEIEVQKDVYDYLELIKNSTVGITTKLIINTEEEALNANEMLKAIKRDFKWVEETRASIKKPIIELGRKIDTVFRNGLDSLECAEKFFKVALIDFNKKNEVHLKGSSISTKTVADITDINAIPPDYYLNNQKVQEAIKTVMQAYAKNRLPIPGITYRDETIMSTRAA